MISTVLGDIEPNELGFCQCHEHLYIAKGRSFEINPDLCIDDAEKTADELRRYRAAGGCAVVDAQPVGCGRDAGILEYISRESGVHIIASTGFHKLLFYQQGHWIFEYDEDKLTRLFIDELTCGMYGLCDYAAPLQKTGLRAGQIKTALDVCGLEDGYRKLFTAAASAANETGRVIMAHIEAGADAVMLADFLMKQGVDAERIVFCHMDRTVSDLGIHREICERGIAVEYDTIARPKYHGDDRETQILLSMIAQGFVERIVMSLDTTRARLKSYGGTMGLDYILDAYIPKLFAAGVGRDVIERIFVYNPMRIFSAE